VAGFHQELRAQRRHEFSLPLSNLHTAHDEILVDDTIPVRPEVAQGRLGRAATEFGFGQVAQPDKLGRRDSSGCALILKCASLCGTSRVGRQHVASKRGRDPGLLDALVPKSHTIP